MSSKREKGGSDHYYHHQGTGVEADPFFQLLSEHTSLRRVASTDRGEYAGPCPFCAGTDRFRFWPCHSSGQGRYWCRQCNEKGDEIQFRRTFLDMSFADARAAVGRKVSYSPRPQQLPKPVRRPPQSTAWGEQAGLVARECEEILWGSYGTHALAYLHGRGLDDHTIRTAGLGFNYKPRRQVGSTWGLTAQDSIFIGCWITIPWTHRGQVFRIGMRAIEPGQRYAGVKGNDNGLFSLVDVLAGRVVVLVEGEFDALSIMQATGGTILGVATGSVQGARRPAVVARLAVASIVLVAFDRDMAGTTGAQHWVDVLGNARRWAPLREDVNDMLMEGISVCRWLAEGLVPDRVCEFDRQVLRSLETGVTEQVAEREALQAVLGNVGRPIDISTSDEPSAQGEIGSDASGRSEGVR
jgi:DNA primase